ncbi:hypothetical protein N7462_001594 [Penicillium macrosclerotiorum]|uniref:uncharacterized protein n=1 Tax=Penicillium macrosclerotiorum TaxID=303699 RepID=UPI0025479753|nr:uncharacterized protein N7462_001594 [Penicillium macrosclerotiorum]KAJ5692171.1 hypothetical protein N7462_001594 [Penicillium macrosclerotiorum]
MASSMRLPTGSIITSTRPSLVITQSYASGLHQYRAFSQASQRWAYRTTNMRPSSVAQPSMKSRAKDMMMSQLPNDIGLLPGTFVRPLWKDMPSIFKDPRDRIWMEWVWIKNVVQNYFSILIFCKRDLSNLDFVANQMNGPFLKKSITWPGFFRFFHDVPRKAKAQELLTNMYTALANGDTREIQRICSEKLATKLTAQIKRRPANEEVTWNLVKWNGSPRVLSDRALRLPEVPNSGIRQVVVRLSSKQSMAKSTRARNGSTAVTAPAKEQDCIEYVVIQKIFWRGQDADWRIWGHVKPTDMDVVNSDASFAPGLSAMERMEMMKESLGRK